MMSIKEITKILQELDQLDFYLRDFWTIQDPLYRLDRILAAQRQVKLVRNAFVESSSEEDF